MVVAGATGPDRGAPAVDAVAPAVGHPPELLVVLVEQGAGVARHVPDRGTGEPVRLVEPAHARAAEHVRDGRAGMAREIGQAMGPIAVAGPGSEDGLDTLPWQGMRRAVRPGAAVQEARRPLGPVAPQPLVRGRPAHAELVRHHRRGLAQDHHQVHQQLAGEHAETGTTMCHESLPTVRCFDYTHYRGSRLSFVNNVSVNHS